MSAELGPVAVEVTAHVGPVAMPRATDEFMDLLEVRDIIAGVQYKDWIFDLSNWSGRPVLRLMWNGIDAYAGVPALQQSRPWVLEARDPSELLRTVWLAVTTAEEHETRELFKFRGRRIFGPHQTVPGSWR